jgi:outer membrane immunogenic protein
MRHLILLFTFLTNLSVAQTVCGIKGGLNVSDIVMTNYINPDVESDLGLKLGLHAGVFANGWVNERLGMAVELLYSDKGVRSISNVHLHYITLPFLVQYKLTKRLYGEAGPEFCYLVSATSKHGNMSNTYSNKFDLGLNAGFRFDTPRIILGIRYGAGIFSVKEPIEAGGAPANEKIKFQNRVLQVSAGYKLWIFEPKRAH